ncbi:hypothetical protein C2G38_2141138 [Gigaspora rosea]|uniref:Golgi to ER traffic protein 2 n=1 Tax=Gigaspora rosea TaxID=44941 RepID=A0A397VES7_9GLOM|nr:hypothetical protein C2G38_2141138 [Gigaspora rosea]
MSEESTSNAKKSRSLSDAERRLLRRQKRILNNANDRLGRITSTHSSSSLNTEPSSTLTSRSVSPQPSLTSSPITYEAPDSIFSSRKNTGNFESLPPPLYSDSPLQPSPDRQTFTPLIRINNDTDPQKLFLQQDRENPSFSASTSDDDRNGYFENNEHSRRKLTNLDPANSSSASLASISPEDLTIYDEINNYCQQQQQQHTIQPFPFLPFLNPDLMNSVPSGQQQQQLDVQSKLWQLIHFFTMIILGLLVTWSEVFRRDGSWSRFTKLIYKHPREMSDIDQVSNWSLFWYFVTVELILQTSRLFLQKNRTFGGTTLGAIAANLPPPLSDALTILLRYNLIWNSLWEDICVLGFVVGFYIMISPILSTFLW